MAITSVSAASTVRSLNARHRQTANYSSSKLLSFSFSSLQLPVELRQVRLANGGLFSQSRSRISPLVTISLFLSCLNYIFSSFSS
uniref:Thioredoxin Y1ic-like isoform X2 n=1 Tax=Rhizophora mucronata TaxID=61149 RepID=A0A2P2MI29_RHIMU